MPLRLESARAGESVAATASASDVINSVLDTAG